MTVRELSRLPVRQAMMTGVSAASSPPAGERWKRGWEKPLRLAKALSFNTWATWGVPSIAASVPVELYGYTKSPITLRPTGPLVTGVDDSWRTVETATVVNPGPDATTNGAAWWQALSGSGIRTTEPNAEFRCRLSSLPSNAKSIRSVIFGFTASKQSGQPLTIAALQIVESDGVTPITEETAPTLPATAHRPLLVGSDSAARWEGAQLRLVSSDDSSGTITISSLTVRVSYRVDLEAEMAVESTGEIVSAVSRIGVVKPGDWCYLHRFLWDHSPSTDTGREIVAAPVANGFSLSITPTGQNVGPGFFETVDAGSSKAIAVAITRYGGFTGTISMTVVGLPSGVTASFSPASVTGTSSTLTLSADSSLPTQRFVIVVTGTSGSEVREEYGAILLRNMTGDFTFTGPASMTVARLTFGTVQFVATSIDSDFVTLGFLRISGTPAPSNTTFSFSESTVVIGEGSSYTLTMTVYVQDAVTGSYPMTIRATGGGQTKDIPFTLVVP